MLQTIQRIELFHLAFLEVLQVRVNQNNYILKGGANLRYFFKSPRYSEDIDLDAVIITKERLQERVDSVLTSRPLAFILRAQNMVVKEITKPKQTKITQRWKIVLASSDSDQVTRTRVEFSRRQADPRNELAQVSPEIVRPYALRPPTLRHYLAEAAIEQKIEALSQRAETQARDVFDLDLLLRQYPEIVTKLTIPAAQVRAAIERATELPFRAFRSQVVAFLDPEVAEIFDNEQAWDQIQSNVVEKLRSAI